MTYIDRSQSSLIKAGILALFSFIIHHSCNSFVFLYLKTHIYQDH